MAHAEGIRLKKKFGQHFLRDKVVVQHMLDAVTLDTDSSVFEIGCGDGFLTRAILQMPLARLWVFEIDPEWAKHIETTVQDKRLQMFQQNFLEIESELLEPFKPWTILSNLPYQVTFPILHWFQQNRDLMREGVVMIQEEVAQKITKKSGRGYGFPALFFQRFFEWQMLDKIPPSAFHPPPKVFSRLLYFKPRSHVDPIPDEEGFWQFIKVCFKQPRRTMRNNLTQAHYNIDNISSDLLAMRAQQLSMQNFIELWDSVR